MKASAEIIVYAFRYALGRQSYCTLTMSDYIIDNWDKFPHPDQDLFQREIKEAIETNRAGHQMDIRAWLRILELPA